MSRPRGGSQSRKAKSPPSAVDAFVAENKGKWPTGSRWARGSHGGRYVQDPLGYDWPTHLVPWGRPSKADVARALRDREAAA
jgi:hypothetical protein